MFPKLCPACNQKALSHDENDMFCTNCPIYRTPLNIFQKPLAWAEHRAWWWRVPIIIWFVSMLIGNLQNYWYALYRFNNPFSLLDFGIHELGHVLFSPFGQFMHILGGSLFQCLFPIFWLFGFLQKKYYFAASLCLCWLGLNLFDVAMYVGDAKNRLLPLAGGPATLGVDPNNAQAAYDQGHDWYQLLSRTGYLGADTAIAHGLRIAATVIFISGLVIAAILVIRMFIYCFRKQPDRDIA